MGFLTFYLATEFHEEKGKKGKKMTTAQQLPFRLSPCAAGQFRDVPESDFASSWIFFHQLEALLDHRA